MILCGTQVFSIRGSVLGPVLFFIYLNDIPVKDNIHLSLFADDTALFTSSWRIDTITNRLTDMFSRLTKYYNRWKIRIIVSKTQAILFTKRRPNLLTNITNNNQTIEWTRTVTYLGLQLDRSLTLTTHIDGRCQKAKGLIISLFPLLNRNSPLSVNNKILLHNTIVRPMLTYAAPY